MSELTNISRFTINKIFKYIHMILANCCEDNSKLGAGEIELDESYFGARRVKGIRGCGAREKMPVFEILKRDDKVYTQILRIVLYQNYFQ